MDQLNIANLCGRENAHGGDQDKQQVDGPLQSWSAREVLRLKCYKGVWSLRLRLVVFDALLAEPLRASNSMNAGTSSLM